MQKVKNPSHEWSKKDQEEKLVGAFLPGILSSARTSTFQRIKILSGLLETLDMSLGSFVAVMATLTVALQTAFIEAEEDLPLINESPWSMQGEFHEGWTQAFNWLTAQPWPEMVKWLDEGNEVK